MTKIGRRAITLTLTFLLLSPFTSAYQWTEGYYQEEEGLDFLEFTNLDTESALANVMTEDGFLLKPALNTTDSDRSDFNEVFAYTVDSGDTLSSIAQRFGLKKETVMWENNLWNPNQVRSGMTLKILPVDGVSHMVKKGHTVAGLAKKYNVDKELIMRQNQLETDELIENTLLIIPGAKKALPIPTYAPTQIPAPNLAKANGQLLWPVGSGAKLTQGFRRGHYGIDLANRAKGPIYAAAAGKVILAESCWNGGYGNYLIVDHGDGLQTLYAHTEKIYVSVGQYVEQGQTVAWIGNSGRSSGPHVHFEVRINGVKYNPFNFY